MSDVIQSKILCSVYIYGSNRLSQAVNFQSENTEVRVMASHAHMYSVYCSTVVDAVSVSALTT